MIFSLARTRRISAIPAAVGTYIGAAYFFTSSTSFANPAIAFGRMFSDSFAGIAPSSVPGFIVAELIGGAAAIFAIRALYPQVTSADAAKILLPHEQDPTGAAGVASRPVADDARHQWSGGCRVSVSDAGLGQRGERRLRYGYVAERLVDRRQRVCS